MVVNSNAAKGLDFAVVISICIDDVYTKGKHEFTI